MLLSVGEWSRPLHNKVQKWFLFLSYCSFLIEVKVPISLLRLERVKSTQSPWTGPRTRRSRPPTTSFGPSRTGTRSPRKPWPFSARGPNFRRPRESESQSDAPDDESLKSWLHWNFLLHSIKDEKFQPAIVDFISEEGGTRTDGEEGLTDEKFPFRIAIYVMFTLFIFRRSR